MRVWSWRQAIQKSPLHSTTKLVLLNLSIYMNEVGEGCYPTTSTQAKDTGLSERTVCTHLEKAVEAGFIVKQLHGYGKQNWARNEYIASYPKGTELDAKALNLTTKGTEPDDRKALKDVQSNTPDTNTPIEEKEVTKVTSKKPIAKKPDDVSQELWSEFLDYRRGMKARLTPTALKGFVREASNANISLSQAIEHTMLMGWRGFKAEWYKNQTKTKQNEDEPKW